MFSYKELVTFGINFCSCVHIVIFYKTDLSSLTTDY